MDGLFDPTITSIVIHFHDVQLLWCQMEHSLHPNMNSGISVSNNTFIHFSSYKQFCKDTHSIVLIYPVKYLVKWVSILNSRNSDDL